MRTLVLALLLVACRKSDAGDTEPPATRPRVSDVDASKPILAGEYVVLRPGALIYAGKNDKKPTIRVASRSPAGLVMRVVVADGERLTVTNSIEGHHCALQMPNLMWAELKLYVDRADLESIPWESGRAFSYLAPYEKCTGGAPAAVPDTPFTARARKQGPRDFVIRAGTPVTTPDGTQVGHALVNATYQEELAARSSVYCLPLPPIIEPADDRAGLCLPNEAVTVRTARTATRVTETTATVKGALDKDIVRRVVRAHLGEVRSCYNDGLARDPTLTGTVAIQFTIGPEGSVPVAVVARDNLGMRDVGTCIARAVKRWRFPKPQGGGNVVVTYPFRLVPG